MTTYYVDPSSGGTNSGTQANPWTSLQTAADTAVAGDIVYCTGTQTLSAPIDFDTNSGSVASGLIKFIGCNGSWAVDGTRFVLNANSTASMCIDPAAVSYIWWENFELKNATNAGCDYNASNANYNYWVNCYSHDNTSAGWDTYYGNTGGIHFFRCIAASCGNGWLGGYRDETYQLCNAVGNTTAGWNMSPTGNLSFYGCVSHGNGAGCLFSGSVLAQIEVRNCVIDGNTGDGIDTASAANGLMITGCRITNNGGYGIDADGHVFYGWNYFANNTSGNTAGGRFSPIPYDSDVDSNETTGTTGYTNQGSDDFNLTSSATLRRTAISIDGTNNFYITAGLPPVDTGGGGGTSGRQGLHAIESGAV